MTGSPRVKYKYLMFLIALLSCMSQSVYAIEHTLFDDYYPFFEHTAKDDTGRVKIAAYIYGLFPYQTSPQKDFKDRLKKKFIEKFGQDPDEIVQKQRQNEWFVDRQLQDLCDSKAKRLKNCTITACGQDDPACFHVWLKCKDRKDKAGFEACWLDNVHEWCENNPSQCEGPNFEWCTHPLIGLQGPCKRR